MTARRETLPNRRGHEVFEFEHQGSRYLAGIGRFADGRPAEIFLNHVKDGSHAHVNARDGAIALSLGLQHGLPLAVVRHAITREHDGAASGALGKLLDLIDTGATASGRSLSSGRPEAGPVGSTGGGPNDFPAGLASGSPAAKRPAARDDLARLTAPPAASLHGRPAPECG